MAAEAALAALLIAGAVEVESNTPCPGAAEVAGRLPAPSDRTGPPDRAVIRASDGRLLLSVVRADGSVVVERQLEARGSCADLAAAVALIVTVWQAQEHPALPAAPRLAEAPPPARLWSVEARTDLVASLAGAEVEPGAALFAALWRRRWGLALSLSGTTPRAQALGRGQASWLRGAVGLGPARRLFAGWARVDLRIEAVLGITVARGSGYATDASPVGPVPGGRAGLDVSHAWGRLVVAAGAGATYWAAQELAVDASPDRRALPRTEAHAGAGVGFRFDL